MNNRWNNRWFRNMVGTLQKRYQSNLEGAEKALDNPALDLPLPSTMSRRTTTIIVMGLTLATGWGFLARVDVVVSSRGKLEPLSASQAIQSRTGGMITSIQVREGEQVEKEQLLMQIDKKPLLTRKDALTRQRDLLVKEVEVLRAAREGRFVLSGEGLSPELRNRVQDRLLLVAQITGDDSGLAPAQHQRYQLFRQQLQNQVSINSLRVSALQTQVSGADAQLSTTSGRLKVEQEIVDRLQPLVKAGAISRNSYLQRVLEVSNLENQVVQNRVQKSELMSNAMQAQADGSQTVGQFFQGLQRELAAIDTQIDTVIKDDQRQLIQINAQLEQTNLDLEQQDLRSPVTGVVFDLGQRVPGVLAQPGQVLLQVVPNESLIARVQVANKDIGSIREGMPVEVRIDAFPFTEFGSVKGVVSKVGSDAVPIDRTGQATAFPVEIRLDKQFLEKRQERFNLTPGMATSANIKIESRAPISFVFGEIVRAFDGLRSAR